MDKKGFTLVELLGVIALLGILSAIAVPVIDNALKSSRNSLDKTQQAQIIKGAKEFFAENTYCLPGSNNKNKCIMNAASVSDSCKTSGNTCGTITGNECKILVKCIKDMGFLPQNITNIQTEKKYDENDTKVAKVKVAKENSNYKYEVIEE